ncbi:energy transducer TonB [Vibrio galatheae]|uniref:Energy transducer TonB n=1 Tax=Vibrio galatheae TaxID=579748 RepID=A0A0F4NIR1_9VIBR|nr:energy transducer TonB [Vibrio galatheae]KJY82839.1 energy transducer TonB [Vibrio galatheae]
MNIKRYTMAASLSLAIHTGFVFIAQEPKAFAMPAGTQSHTVSINFKAVTPPTKPEVTATKPTAEPIEKALTTTQDQKTSQKPTPVERKIAHKKPAPEKKTAKQMPKTKTAPSPEQTINKQPVRPNDQKREAEQNKPQTQVVNQGASAQPVLITKPSFVTRPTAPKYPRLARKRGVEGVALYEIWLDEQGNQIKQVLITSSGAEMLDHSALVAIKKWRFSPHSVDGQKMAHRVQIPVRFKLD